MTGWTGIYGPRFREASGVLRRSQRANGAALLVEILFRCRRHPGVEGGFPLGLGQCVLGQDEVAEVCGLTRRGVRTLLKGFQKGGIMTTKATSQGTVVSVLGFAGYVFLGSKSSQQSDQQSPSERPASDQPVTNNEREYGRGQRSKPDPVPAGASAPEDNGTAARLAALFDEVEFPKDAPGQLALLPRLALIVQGTEALVWEQERDLLAFLLTAAEKDNPVGWLVTVLSKGRFGRPSDRALEAAKVLMARAEVLDDQGERSDEMSPLGQTLQDVVPGE